MVHISYVLNVSLGLAFLSSALPAAQLEKTEPVTIKSIAIRKRSLNFDAVPLLDVNTIPLLRRATGHDIIGNLFADEPALQLQPINPGQALNTLTPQQAGSQIAGDQLRARITGLVNGLPRSDPITVRTAVPAQNRRAVINIRIQPVPGMNWQHVAAVARELNGALSGEEVLREIFDDVVQAQLLVGAENAQVPIFAVSDADQANAVQIAEFTWTVAFI